MAGAPIRTRGFSLADWQMQAFQAWAAGDDPFRGTLEIFTGGGKTLIALKCIEEASNRADGLKVAVVVPTEALALQWVDAIVEFTDVPREQIGLLGAGGRDTFEDHRALVCVINSAAKRLPDLARGLDTLILIIDECHRAGAATFSRVLSVPARFRLGLSATPDRDEFDDAGEPITYADQIAGQRLGAIVYRFTLRDARDVGWLPDYEIHHHGLRLLKDERAAYEELSREVDDLADRLGNLGVETGQAQKLSGRDDDVGRVARAYVAVVGKRKDVLYRARERTRIATRIVVGALEHKSDVRALLFHERVDEAKGLFHQLAASAHDGCVRLEHSKLPTKERRAALEAFRRGDARILVSVKALIEGIDVPEADVGVSVASTSSVRQRVQSLGRVLRRLFEAGQSRKQAAMHLLYVAETADEAIYGKEDWSDLTGEGANFYWLWPNDPSAEPERREGPPRRPKPTENQEWERLGQGAPSLPQPWLGVVPSREYSVDTRRTVTTVNGTVVSNPQGVAEMITAVRKTPGGRFYVTPTHRLVIVRGEGKDAGYFVAGRIEEPFQLLDNQGDQERARRGLDVTLLSPGDPYYGPLDKANGTYKLAARRGGVIERSCGGGGKELALLDKSRDRELAANARHVLAGWRRVATAGFNFYVNSMWHAWYLQESQARFLAEVPRGFEWPSGEQSP
jgi:superfamily II DNA or RNA helicase